MHPVPGTPEIGGLTTREAQRALRLLRGCQIVGRRRRGSLTALRSVRPYRLNWGYHDVRIALRHRQRGPPMTHGYETGRLDLPFVGICSFGKYPIQLDWEKIDCDVAILGAPFDGGTQFRPGARFGPRAIREASTLFSFGHAGAYDHEDDVTYLAGVKIADIGDADIVHTNTEFEPRQYRARCSEGFGGRRVAGGPGRVIIPSTSPAFAPLPMQRPVHLVQIDAHLDFVE